MTAMYYLLTDGNATDYHDTLASASAAACEWYDYLLDATDGGEVTDALREAVESVDCADADTIRELQSQIVEWEGRIAAACGVGSVDGHGSYHVSAADRMGLRLTVSEIPSCDSGQATGEACQWSGDASELTTIEYMPEYLRASHEAAGGVGLYPHNGAIRISVCPACAETLVDGDWCVEVVNG